MPPRSGPLTKKGDNLPKPDPSGIWACPRCTNENSGETCQACGYAPEWPTPPKWGDRIPQVGAYIVEFTIQDLHALLEMAGARNGRVQVAVNTTTKKWATSFGLIAPPHEKERDWFPPQPMWKADGV